MNTWTCPTCGYVDKAAPPAPGSVVRPEHITDDHHRFTYYPTIFQPA